MEELEMLKEIKDILSFLLMMQFFFFLKSIFGIVASFINSFLD